MNQLHVLLQFSVARSSLCVKGQGCSDELRSQLHALAFWQGSSALWESKAHYSWQETKVRTCCPAF